MIHVCVEVYETVFEGFCLELVERRGLHALFQPLLHLRVVFYGFFWVDFDLVHGIVKWILAHLGLERVFDPV